MPLSERPFGPVSGAASVANQPPINVPAALSGPLPAKQVLLTTAETVILSPENLASALVVPIPPNMWPYEQTEFDLWASGIITTTQTGTVTLKLYSGTSTTVGSNTLLGTSGAITQNTATASWWCHARLMFDSVSGTLVGDVEFYVNKTKVAQVTLSNFPTGVNLANDPVASFLLTATSSVPGTAGCTINVQRFTVG